MSSAASFCVDVHVARSKNILHLTRIASFDALLCAVEERWPDLTQVASSITHSKSIGNSEIKSDSDLCSFSAGASIIRLYVDVKVRGFSSFKNDRGRALALVKAPFLRLDRLPEVELPSETTGLTDAAISRKVECIVNELRRRYMCINVGLASEYTMREFISVILIGAVTLCPEVTMVCERRIIGQHALGPSILPWL